MFTVILVSERSRRLVEPWLELFKPFEARGALAFCAWNADGNAVTLDQAAPELAGVVKGRPEWRAIVLLNPDESAPDIEGNTTSNPFDYHPDGDLDAERVWDHSPWPAIRLTHMLLGLPELGPKGFAPDPSFRDPVTNETIYRSSIVDGEQESSDSTAQDEFTRRALLGNHPHIHYRVIPASEEESRSHETLAQHYGPHQSMPGEVLLVAPRIPSRQRPLGILSQEWSRSEDLRSSRFVERNAYPASCRFLTFELSPAKHVHADVREMTLMLSLLTLATNDLPASGLQAERLYRLDLDIDPVLLANSLNQHMWQLLDVRQRIDAKLEQAHRPLPSTPQDLLTEDPITVDFSMIKGEDLAVALSGYGLAAESPFVERGHWEESVRGLRAAAQKFARQPPRTLRHAVADARKRIGDTVHVPSALSDLDIEELETELSRRSDSLVQQARPDVIDGEKLASLIDGHDKIISKAMLERMPLTTVRLAAASVLGAWALALAPYVIATAFDGVSNVAESLVVSLVILSLVAGTGLVTLALMRGRFLGLLRSLNLDLRMLVGRVTQGMDQYAQYLTGIATYVRGRRLLISEQRRVATLQDSQRQLRRVRTRIDERLETEKSLVRAVGRPVQIERPAMHMTETPVIEHETASDALLWEPGRTACQFNRSGDSIIAPYAFVTRIIVEDLGIYEPAADGSRNHQSESATGHDANQPDLPVSGTS